MKHCNHLVISPQITAKGGLLVTVKGENDKQQRFVTAHVDTPWGHGACHQTKWTFKN